MVLHPGRILLEQYLAPRGISVWHLARDIGVSVRKLYEIVQGRRSISPEIALRLAHYFGSSKRFWLGLQARYDLQVMREIQTARVVNISTKRNSNSPDRMTE